MGEVTVEIQVQRDLVFLQVLHELGSPVCFGPLLMKQDLLLGGGDRVGAAGDVVPGVSCLFGPEKKHCLLELGARGVKELVQSEVYPIVIHVEVTEKNVREIR